MGYIFTVIGILIGLIIGLVILLLYKKNQERKSKPDQDSFLLIQNQIQELTRLMDAKIGESTRQMHDSVTNQLNYSQNLIKEITQELTAVKETGRQMTSIGDQVKSLQDILKNPKQRGVLGEYYLETLLKNVLPPGSYKMQYGLADGEIVDAMIFVKDKLIPVDSKFSLENYNRLVEEKNSNEKEKLEKAFVADLKQRIQETTKYIRPEEGTMDFAFMFIPHEAIYYDLLINRVGGEGESIIERAAGKNRVIIVSPTSFLAYLQTVLQGLKALQIEEQAVEIKKRVGELSRHINGYDQYLKKLGGTLSTTVNHYNQAYKEFKKIDKDIFRISQTGGEIDPLKIEKPDTETD